MKRGVNKLMNVMAASDATLDHMDPDLPEGLHVIEPLMYPGFRSAWQRKFNRIKLTRSIHQCFGQTFATKPLVSRVPAQRSRRVVLTTLPITADVVDRLDVDRWIYYCVDDYSRWPGTDHAVMHEMEWELVAKVDAVACVSETLHERVASMGRGDATLLTHGVAASFWMLANGPDNGRLHQQVPMLTELNGSPLTFWGLIDDRLDRTWIAELSRACAESNDDALKVCLVGPVVGDSKSWTSLTHDEGRFGSVMCCGRADHDLLPSVAYYSRVLIMPYGDAPVTRAMQPLKLLEYLATMKPVVVRDLPATRAWADCCDLAGDEKTFAKLVMERARTGTPADQIEARKRRLPGESWSAKAAQLAGLISAG
ncbi:MAG: hypothetical protein AAGH88_15195 [Planctomycetota bacterium]